MQYHFIPWILGLEQDADFQSSSERWRPKNLLELRQAHLLLQDIKYRRNNLELAKDELVTLRYADRYLKYLRRMRLWVRDASFAWKSDQLKFLNSVAGFYTDYGAILRLLRIDSMGGAVADQVVDTTLL